MALIVTGAFAGWIYTHLIENVTKRTIQLQAQCIAAQVVDLLDQCKDDLVQLSNQTPLTETGLTRFWTDRKSARGWAYAELSHFSQGMEEPIILVAAREGLVEIADRKSVV